MPDSDREVPESPGRRALHWLVLPLAATLLWVTFRRVSPDQVTQLLGRAGGRLGWVLLPFLVVQLADATAIRVVVRKLGSQIRLRRALAAQVAGEASTMGLPMGFLVGESVRPWLLSSGTSLDVGRALAAVTGRKFMLTLTEGALIILASVVSVDAALEISSALTGGPWLWLVGLAFGVLLVGVAALISLGLKSGDRAHALFRWLRGVAPSRARRALERAESHFVSTDRELSAMFRLPVRDLVAPATLWFVGVWVVEGVEVWLILSLVGVPVDLSTAIYLESIVALARSILPVAPAGLGIQDAGYVGFLTGLGVPDAASVGAAFCLVKRSREALWCLIGGACLVTVRKRTGRLAATAAISRTSEVALPSSIAPRAE